MSGSQAVSADAAWRNEAGGRQDRAAPVDNRSTVTVCEAEMPLRGNDRCSEMRTALCDPKWAVELA